MTGPAAPSVIPAGVTGEGDGIKVGAGLVRVDLFIDFMCPFCRRFELLPGRRWNACWTTTRPAWCTIR